MALRQVRLPHHCSRDGCHFLVVMWSASGRLAESHQVSSGQSLDRKPEPVAGDSPLEGQGERPIVSAGDDPGRHVSPTLKRPRWAKTAGLSTAA